MFLTVNQFYNAFCQGSDQSLFTNIEADSDTVLEVYLTLLPHKIFIMPAAYLPFLDDSVFDKYSLNKYDNKVLR
jgi:hypothetical protein